ncbi:MAG: rhodanese-like domain-containing protein [Kineosporiaceae bacterium]|nr:rhodanese-like domain-containing protein [Kineosporiaceae bacterium]
MPRRPTASLVAALALALPIGLAGCSGDQTGAPLPAASSAAYAAIIDVRTPAEYASGHVAGARNIDVQSAAFATEIAALPETGTYLVYCRSGNRSAQASETMRKAGLTVVDGGGLSDMSKLGYPFGA